MDVKDIGFILYLIFLAALVSVWIFDDEVSDRMEEHLPWGVNNGIKWLSQVLFLPWILFMDVLSLIVQPFQRPVWDGGHHLSWGWDCYDEDFLSDFTSGEYDDDDE